MKKTAILIPARYGSTRYPGKPLVDLGGIPMIKRVYDACKATGIDTYVLTDHQDIYNLIGPNAYMDREDYENGTERCAGAIRSRTFDDYDQFINVQGDMPDVTPELIKKAALGLEYYPVSTVFTKMREEDQNNPNTVKMVRAGDQALWFGRGMTGYGEWHLGVYGYKKNALEMYLHMRIEQEERVEKLEQLRWLKNGWQMGCYSVQFNGVEINTEHDINLWKYNYAQQTH